MHDIPYILADTETSITKFIFGAIFFLIWAVSAAMSALAKKKEQERRERVRQQIEHGTAMPPPVPMPPQQRPQMQQPIRRQPMVRKTAPPRPVQRRATPPKIVRRQQQPVPVRQPQPEPEPVRLAAVAPPLPAATAPQRPSSANAATINAWLRPGTLRRQFILTEVLQQPLALREGHLER